MLWGQSPSQKSPLSLIMCSFPSYILCKFHLYRSYRSSKCHHVTFGSLASMEVILLPQSAWYLGGSWCVKNPSSQHEQKWESGRRRLERWPFMRKDSWGRSCCRWWNATNRQLTCKETQAEPHRPMSEPLFQSGLHFWLHFVSGWKCKVQIVHTDRGVQQGRQLRFTIRWSNWYSLKFSPLKK